MIKIENLSYSYKKKRILDNISFELPSGKCIGIIGSNGCGKSTLLSLIAASRKLQQGKIISGNDDIIGYVPQENPLLEDASTLDNLLLWYKGSKKELYNELESDLIKMLDIDSFLRMPVKKLSGGMKKRLAMAIALISKPNVLILDEPSCALDLPCKMDIQKYLRSFLANGGSIIITTHEESELDLCDTIYILNNGILQSVDNKLRGEALCAYLK